MLSRRLAHPSDPRTKFLIYTIHSPSVWEALDSKIKMAIRDVVQSAYNSATNSIDLSNFQANKGNSFKRECIPHCNRNNYFSSRGTRLTLIVFIDKSCCHGRSHSHYCWVFFHDHWVEFEGLFILVFALHLVFNVQGNRLSNLDYIQSFTFACPQIIELDLSDNNVGSYLFYSCIQV